MPDSSTQLVRSANGLLREKHAMEVATISVTALRSRSVSYESRSNAPQASNDPQIRIQAEGSRFVKSALKRIHRLAKVSVHFYESLKGKWVRVQKRSRWQKTPKGECSDSHIGIQRLESHFKIGDKKQQVELFCNSLDVGSQQALTTRTSGDHIKQRSHFPFRSGIRYDFNELEVGELLGKGAHGSVHMGHVSGMTVALKRARKICTKGGTGSGEPLSPEIEIMDVICHPNLVQIYGVHMVDRDWGSALNTPRSSLFCSSSTFSSGLQCGKSALGSEEGNKYLQPVVVMEYCDRGTVWDAVRRGDFCTERMHGVPNYRMIVQAAMEIALAMEHLHSCGFIHGDLTAKNVLLSSAGTRNDFVAKVGDYGLCRRLQHTRDEIITFRYGTVDHMAPETLRDGKVHKGTDVFSFGILLLEMMTGRYPFLAMTPAAVVVAIVEGMRPKIPTSCPSDLICLMHECWHQNWWCRPSFGEILGRLFYAAT